MLIDPATLLSEARLVALLSAVAILAKTIIGLIVVLALGMPGPVALLTGLSLAQIGEFSFVLARVGVDAGAIPARLFDLTLATALVTIVVSPTLVRAGPVIINIAQRIPGAKRLMAEPVEPTEQVEHLARHAVICGYGRIGSELAQALEARGVPYLVIEYNPVIARSLRQRNVPVIYGDSANPAVLEHAHLDRARLLAVLMPDVRAAEVTTRHARAMNPRLDVVARGGGVADLERLRLAGATEVVQPEFEAGQEVIRHTLRRFGLGGLELSNLITGRRAAYYRRMAEDKPE
jgi:CPA2 family monovalent cation:H+ antiporter-2